MSETYYSSREEAEKAALGTELVTPNARELIDPAVSLFKTSTQVDPASIPEDVLGEQVAYLMARYQTQGYVPTFREAIAYRKVMNAKKTNLADSIGDAMVQTTTDLGSGVVNLAGDALTLKVHKVGASLIEGAARGTKNWWYMYEQAKYDENSFLSKMLYDNDVDDEQYYENLKKTIELNKVIEKDKKEGIWINPQIELFGEKFDLTNEGVVQAVSYVADPSWLMPNLGIEASLAKGMRSMHLAGRLGEQLTNAAGYAAKKTAKSLGKIADWSGNVANAVQVVDSELAKVFTEATGTPHYINQSGSPRAVDAIYRNAENSLGANVLRVPLWPLTSSVFGVSKVVQGFSLLGEAYAENAFESKMLSGGLTLSERVAASSEGSRVASIASFYSRNLSPLTDWMTKTAKTGIHGGMYGGAFGLFFGGEEGAAHGFGTGIVLGSAFHQVGAFAETVAGTNKYRDTLKNFIWATEHYDYNNQEGLYHLMNRVTELGGEEARWSLMAQIGAFERIQRDQKVFILTEAKIKEMSSAQQWNEYEQMILSRAEDWGGVTFSKDLNGDNVILINADRAVKSALNEELFHSLLLEGRYKKAFVKNTVEHLLGTEDNQGALYRMPREQAIAVLEQFRDQYLDLDKKTAGHIPEALEGKLQEFNRVIEMFRNGERPPELNALFEEFTASYWNRYIEEKPLDYLLKGGNLGLVRNAIEWGKDLYRGLLKNDLSEAGVRFADANGNPDLFLINERTKQRVRVPMMERLMKQYVKEINDKMYKGWVVDEMKYRDTHTLLNNQLEHLVRETEVGKVNADVNLDNPPYSISDAIGNIAQRLQELNPSERSLKMQIRNENGQTLASFSRAKKKTVGQTFWRDEDRRNGVGLTKSQLREMGGVKKGKPPVERDIPKPEGRWSVDKRGQFWESVWEGNPRIVFSGRATNAELSILAEYLPMNVVKRFNELNRVIEHAKSGKPNEISNVVKAAVITESKEKNSGERIKKRFMSSRRFIPVELSLYFDRVLKKKTKDGDYTYKVGEANMLVKVIDYDALLTREDYAYNKVDDADLNYKTVRRLFGSRAELREAVKAMLSNYSLGNKAQAGVKLFLGGRGGERDAALKRDIVNAVIGYHPTQAMERNVRSFWNTPREMQFRQSGDKVKLPTVMTDFRVDFVGTMRVEDGEGFRYNHDEAYKRSQANFSPAITSRDHEGNMLPFRASKILSNTVYRNKEGEIISVYSLRTPYSELRTKANPSQIFDVTVGEMVNEGDISGAVRGNMYTSPSGWLHFTADGHEAGYTATGRIRSGYIDTKNHLDISDLGNSGSYRTMVAEIGKRVAEVSNTNAVEFIKELLKLEDAEGNSLGELFKNEKDLLGAHLDTVESWLFTRQSRELFAKYGIDSIEYMAVNPNTGHEFSSVAVFDSGRFVENRSRGNLDHFRFSPSKPLSEQLDKLVKKAGGDGVKAVMRYTIDIHGNPVFNRNLITTEIINRLVRRNELLVSEAQRMIDDNKLLSNEAVRSYEEKLIPVVFQKLKAKFPEADDELLKSIAKTSLKGFVDFAKSSPRLRRKVAKPFGATTEIVSYVEGARVTNSGFIEGALKAGIDSSALIESGIPSLGHWIEMSEAEFAGLRGYEQWRKKKQSENTQAIKDVREFEKWLKEHSKKYDVERTGEQRRAEGEMLTEIERMRAKLQEQGVSEKNIQARIDEQFPAYSSMLAKAKERIDKLKQEETERFEKLSPRAQEMFALSKEERKNTKVFVSREKFLEEKLSEFRMRQGVQGLANSAARQDDLFFVMDAAMTPDFALSDKFNLSAGAKMKLKAAMVLKTRQLVVEQLKLGNRATFRQINEAYTQLVDSQRNIPTELSEAMAKLADYQRKAESIIKKDHAERMLDVMTAYGIKELDLDIVEQVRAVIYDEASQGKYDVGSFEAIARSAEVYAYLDGLKNKRYIDVRKSIEQNFVKALDELEKKGYRASYWSKYNTDVYEGYLSLGKELFKAKDVLKFDGGEYYIVYQKPTESNIANHRIMFLDGDGKILNKIEYSVSGDARDAAIIHLKNRGEIIKQATFTINKNSPTLAIKSGKFMEVLGGSKDYLLRQAFKARGLKSSFTEKWTAQDALSSQMDGVGRRIKTAGGESLIISDAQVEKLTAISKHWELYKNGDFFLAVPVLSEKVMENGMTVVENERILRDIVRTGKIEHPEVKQGRKVIPARTEVLTPQQIAAKRVELVRVQQMMLPDLGFTFKLDNDGSIEIIKDNFQSLQQREESFADLKANAAHIKAGGLEKLVSKAYIDFAKMLQKHDVEHRKRVATVLSEKDKRGAIPQIKELINEINNLEATRRQYITKEMLRYNRENEKRGTGKKESVDAKRMGELLVDRLDNYRRRANALEAQVLAVADQLDRAGLLSEKEGFSVDAVDDYQRRIALAGDGLEQFKVPEPARGTNIAEYYANLKMEFRRRQVEFVNSERMATQLHDALYGHQEGVEKILPKVEFLIKRYLEARGFSNVDINSSVFLKSTSRKGQFKLKSVSEELGSYITNEEGYTTVRWQELKYGTPYREAGVADAATLQHQLEEPVTKQKFVPVEKGESRYLRDRTNKLESVLDDDFYTKEELHKQFADGLDIVAEKWYRGKDRASIKMESILKMGMERANTEDSIASLLAKNLSEHNLDASEIAWLNSPENRTAVADLHRRWATDEDSPHQIVSEIRELTLSSNYGRDGVNLVATVSKLNETYQKIGAVIDRLQVLTRREVSQTALEQENPFAARMEGRRKETTEEISSYRLNMPETVDELTEELKALRSLKTDLQKRYDAILKKAGGKHASPEFRKLVKSMKDMDVNQRMIRRQTARYFKEKEMIQKQIETAENILFQQYDVFARNIRDQNPELVFPHSRILISKDNPYTQRLFYAFPQLAYDFFGNSGVLLDMSLVAPEGQKQMGITKPINSTYGSGLGNQVLKNERQNGRRNIYLADYIHYAVNKRRWHERNPKEAMSAADAELFRYFFRKDIDAGLFKEQISRIPREKIESQQNFMNGIIDHFRTDDERSRFIRSFVMDAFDLVSKNNGLVERAFMSLKNMTRGEFEALKRSNPDYLKKALDTKEVIERAFYLLPRGVVEATPVGEKVGMRDYAAIKMTPQENLEIRRIERASGYNEGDIRRIINGEINKPLPEEAAKFFKKRQIAFRTREESPNSVPIDTLIRMTGFDSIWKEHMQAQGIDTSLFGLDGMWTVKAAYEDMTPAERFAMPVSKVNRLLLENKANQMKSARESKLRYKKQKKAILDPEGMANWTYGESQSLAVDEQRRVSAILAEAAKTEISIQRYKTEINTLITKRANAVRHMLSLKDNLRIEDITMNKDGELSIDWDNPEKPQWRDTIDGRYFIRRTLHKGKEVFDVIFKGETFKAQNGQVVTSVNTSKFATVTDLTEAQVAIRLFEDDIQRVKVASRMITGGESNLSPLSVGEQPLPMQNVDELVTHWDEVPAFSREVLRMYTEQKGLPFYRERMAEVLAGIGQHGEYVWVRGFPDGSRKSKKIFITPDKRGVYAEHYIKTVAKDGLDLYIRKKNIPAEETSDVQTNNKTVTKESATNPPEAEKPDKVDKVVADASNWDVIEVDKSNKNYEDWTIIKNQLGYTLMRLTDKNNRSIFRLFNPASAFMSETYNEIEAMELILKQELGKL